MLINPKLYALKKSYNRSPSLDSAERLGNGDFTQSSRRKGTAAKANGSSAIRPVARAVSHRFVGWQAPLGRRALGVQLIGIATTATLCKIWSINDARGSGRRAVNKYFSGGIDGNQIFMGKPYSFDISFDVIFSNNNNSFSDSFYK
jgi:hypothetical protein